MRDQYDQFNGEEFVAFRNAAAPAYSAGYSPLEQQGIANGVSTNWQDYLYKQGFVTSQYLYRCGAYQLLKNWINHQKYAKLQ
ncbi:hypothetical protein D3C85_1401840 [compost metagenome]